MQKDRELGIVVYGATGFTGRLVAEYLNQQYGVNGEVVWAMAGRSLAKLEQVRDEMGISQDVPLVVADSSDLASINAMVERTAVVCTTVGPYQLYGNELVEACAAAGTDYVDLCGEPGWMHKMIGAHSQAAEASGARIVFSCGFDSVPFDLGVLFLQHTAEQKLGTTVPRVRGRVRAMKGTFSGGTLASFRTTMAAAAKDRELVNVLRNPFSLTAGFNGAEQPRGDKPMFDEVLQSWVAPFVMASINTKNIHRSNMLMGHSYGTDFVYDEMMMTGPGEKGEAVANHIANDNSMAEDPRQPGEGPDKDERENGMYDVLFVGQADSGDLIKVSVKGDKDPGYGSTSKMIAESAVCLLKNPQTVSGGIWTPAPAMGTLLIERLQANAGLTFIVED
ncbi:MAG: saccharopine dehydrogenase NADP-binding domain-containing protein [Porticoccaceae bacterium]|nr:saccharopine dehydrogenase NADP-binding domain-containing protein [Porticoccaceae bacterium]MDG1307462.1 saccharopine dehydrogenase NADP-binding domain-containing protein [Porticoccaceae bacterium]